jgi:hypothetical protein
MKKPLYKAYQTLNGDYQVVNDRAKSPTEPIYFARFSTKQSDNVDMEVAMANIAGLLNLLEKTDMSPSMRASTEQELAAYNHLKV